MNKSVVIIGPESTGKTTLAKKLVKELSYCLVEEYAREKLKTTEGFYNMEMVEQMSKVQYQREREVIQDNKGRVILDTDLAVYKVWIQDKYDTKIDWIEDAIVVDAHHKIYLLCYPDIEWVSDPFREHPSKDDRVRLYQKYLHILKRLNCNYFIIKGKDESRLKNALNVLRKVL